MFCLFLSILDSRSQKILEVLFSTKAMLYIHYDNNIFSGETVNFCSVSGNNLVTALVVDTIIGLLCYIGFVLWRSSFSIYSRRKWLPNRIRRPPKLHLQGHWRIWSWLIPTWNVPDIELLRSSGFDALVAVRIVSFGIPLFIPYVVLGIAVLLPVNYHGGYLAEEAEKDGNSDSASSGNLTYEFLRLSISNIKPSSSLL